MLKKLLSILLICAMMVSLIPMYASADEITISRSDLIAAVQPGPREGAEPSEFGRNKPSMVAATAVGDNTVSESEPNDTMDTAGSIQNDLTTSGTIVGADLDYFKFTLTSESMVYLTSASDAGYLVMLIVDEEGEVMAASEWIDSDEYLFYDMVMVDLMPGTYYAVLLDNDESSLNYMFYTEILDLSNHTHVWEFYETTEVPTCTTPGGELYVCYECGLTEFVFLPETGHNWVEGAVNPEPTCTSTGILESVCTECGETSSKTLPIIPHDYVDGYCIACGDREPLFPDAPWGQYYSDPIEWAVNTGITNGYPSGLFGTEDTCNRAQVVTFLWRAAGSPEPTATTHSFEDVADNQYYTKAVLWAVEKGITTGLSATKFGPDQPCNRGQVVTFLWRYNGEPAPTSYSHPFTDVDEAQFYFKPILWAYENGITTGTSSTTFSPSNPCTRGQVVTFLYRAVAQPE